MFYNIPTTTWKNGSSFAVLAYFINHKLFGKNSEDFTRTPEFQKLLAHFSEHYQLKKLTVKRLKQILANYPHPADRQFIWIPILRKALAHSLKTDAHYAEQSFNDFESAVVLHRASEPLKGFHKIIYAANRTFFDQTKHNPARGLNLFWQTQGFANVCDYLGDTHQSVSIPLETLSRFCQLFRIKLEVLDPSGRKSIAIGYQHAKPLFAVNATLKNDKLNILSRIERIAAQSSRLWLYGVPSLLFKSTPVVGSKL